MPKQPYTTRELTKEEGEALTKDLQAVLEKHGCDMGVVATIQLLKRVEAKPEDVLTPSPAEFQPNNGNDETKESSA